MMRGQPETTSPWEEMYGPAPTGPTPAREIRTRIGQRRYIAPKWPTAPLFDWLIADGVSPWTFARVFGIQVKWSRPYQPTRTVDRVCCEARKVHPAFIYGMAWACLAEWELAALDRFDTEQREVAA